MIAFIFCLIFTLLGVAASIYQIAHPADHTTDSVAAHEWFVTFPM
jgi:hypothetical protein